MAGKHGEVAKPVANGWADAQATLETQRRAGLNRALSLPFNNDRALGFFCRYVGVNATYIARYSDLEQQIGAFQRADLESGHHHQPLIFQRKSHRARRQRGYGQRHAEDAEDHHQR
jgi:hypothetical protein